MIPQRTIPSDPKNAKPTVFIVDDEPDVCTALHRLLFSVGLKTQVFDAAEKFLSAYTPDQPGCLLLDVRMKGMSGPDLQQQMNNRGLKIPVVFITGHGDVPLSVKAMQNGAADFLQKPLNEQALLNAVFKALSRDAEQRKHDGQRDRIVRRVEQLTPREREVMEQVVVGKLNKQIANDLGISEKTIKVHRGRVMEKMKADSLADLVLMAHSLGMCEVRA